MEFVSRQKCIDYYHDLLAKYTVGYCRIPWPSVNQRPESYERASDRNCAPRRAVRASTHDVGSVDVGAVRPWAGRRRAQVIKGERGGESQGKVVVGNTCRKLASTDPNPTQIQIQVFKSPTGLYSPRTPGCTSGDEPMARMRVLTRSQ